MSFFSLLSECVKNANSTPKFFFCDLFFNAAVVAAALRNYAKTKSAAAT
jgi:Na+/H+ antiporter NhaC